MTAEINEQQSALTEHWHALWLLGGTLPRPSEAWSITRRADGLLAVAYLDINYAELVVTAGSA
jgi:hypothetical protein